MKNIYYLFLIVLFVGVSCEDFLEEVPKSSISPANFYKTADDALAAVNGAYAAFHTDNYYSRYYIEGDAYAGANAYTRTGATSERGSFYNLIDFGMVNNARYNTPVWQAIWEAINRTNAVLNNVPAIEMDETLKARIIAEAKFLRALNYFNLVRRWGGVPLILDETTTSDLTVLQVPKNSLEEIYQQIDKDLTEAIPDLPYIKDYSANDIGRASKESAQGILAKSKLYQKDWSNAKSNAIDVINSPTNLDLMPDPKDNWWMGSGDVDNNVESIFEVQYNGTAPNAHGLGEFFEPNYSGYGSGAWGTVNSNLYFYSKFGDNDKRKEATFLTEYPSLTGDSIVQWYEFRIPSPHVNKFRDPYNKNKASYNIKVLRFADILLIAAEAINESEGPDDAYQYVNRVRIRAGLPGLSGLSKDQLRDSIYWEFRKELAYEGQDYEELVRQGKLLEEKEAATNYTIPIMYDDNGNIYIPSESKVEQIQRYQPNEQYLELDEWNLVWPFPQTSIDKNPNLIQNPGY